jgi:hypothetical protein
MSVEFMEITTALMSLLALFGQPIRDALVAKGVDATVSTIRKWSENDRDAQTVFRKWEKEPRNIRLQSELLDILRAKLRRDPAFLRELSGLVNELGGRAALPQTQPVPPPPALHQLPGDIPEFTGRQHEIAEMLECVNRYGGATSLLVLTGLGGSGSFAKSSCMLICREPARLQNLSTTRWRVFFGRWAFRKAQSPRTRRGGWGYTAPSWQENVP